MVPLIPSTLQGSTVKMTSNILKVNSVGPEKKNYQKTLLYSMAKPV